MALRGGDRERAQGPALERAGDRRRIGDRHRHLPRDHRVRRVAAALVGDVRELGAGLLLEELGRHLERRGARSVVHAVRARLRVLHELLHRPHRERRTHAEEERERADHRHRREVARRRVRELRVGRRVHRHRAGRSHQQGVAVGRRLGDELDRDDRLRARPVLDDHRLPEALGQLRREQARDEVVAAAGRVADDDPDRLRRVVLRRRAGCEGRGRGERGEPEEHPCGHGGIPGVVGSANDSDGGAARSRYSADASRPRS